MQKNNEKILYAYDKGYRVINGKAISPNGNELSVQYTGNRPRFAIRVNGKVIKIYVSRLAAYQIFGNQIFDPEKFVFHANGNPLDNTEANLRLGSYSEAQMSKDQSVRQNAAVKATMSVRKHNHDEIIAMREKGMNYEQIMQATGIKSKGTISFICSKSISVKNKKP